MRNKNAKSLFKEIWQAYEKLRNYILKSFKYKETKNIKRLDNLFKGFIDWNKKKREKEYLHPYKISDYEAEIDEGKLPASKKEKDVISQSMRKLRKLIKSYYDTDGRDSLARFSIDPAGHRGEYRLRAKINGEDFDDTLRKKTEEKLSVEDQRRILDQYLTRVERDFRYLDTKQIGIIPPVPIRIKSSYIHLKATLDESQTEASYLTDRLKLSIGDNFAREKRIAVKPHSVAFPIEQIIENTLKATDESKRRMVFLGDSGSGKSTFLRYLARSAASPRAEELGLKWLRDFIPIFVDLPRYSESKASDLIEFCLNETVKGENHINALKGIIQSCKNGPGEGYRVIFLLDAMDEVRDRRKDIAKEIESKADEYKNALFIVTSRKTGYYEAPLNDFTRYFVEDLTDKEIPAFIRTWFGIVAKTKTGDEPESWRNWSQNKANDLINELNNKPSLKQIATNPLYLTFLVLLASIPYTHLPETRADLFDGYFNRLLVNWEEKRGLPLDQDALLDGYREISWIIHRGIFGDIRDDPTEEFVKKAIERTSILNAGKLVNFWIKAGVLLRTITEHQKILILPGHRSFIEYGFACKLAELWDNEKIRKALQKDLSRNLHNEYLHEPLLIFVGKLENPITFIEYVRNLKDDLFHSNLIFLCEAIREARNKFEFKGVVIELLSGLHEILHSSNPFSQGVQSDICKCIYLLGGNEALKALLKEKSCLSIIIKALRNIAPLCDRSAIPLFTEILENANNEEAKVVLECIAIVEREAALSFLQKLFVEKPTMRIAIARAIIISIGENALSILKELYAKYKTDIQVDTYILVSIGNLGDVKYAMTELLRRFNLLKGFDIESESYGRRVFAVGMAALGDEIGINLVKRIYEEENDLCIRSRLIDAVG